ncbi:MAG TPA: hypothetical protein VGR02_04225 [Thermoanaerobaculia bacterium]|nr:hypothetical protein [Thermoanaerobaculia bacterium]
MVQVADGRALVDEVRHDLAPAHQRRGDFLLFVAGRTDRGHNSAFRTSSRNAAFAGVYVITTSASLGRLTSSTSHSLPSSRANVSAPERAFHGLDAVVHGEQRGDVLAGEKEER